MQAFKRKPDSYVGWTELRAFVFAHTTKQTTKRQSADDKLQTCVRCFRYSYRLLRKFTMNITNKIFADLCHMTRPRTGVFEISNNLPRFDAIEVEVYFDYVS